MKKILITLTLTFSFLCHSFAWFNGETEVLADGTRLYEDAESKVPYGHEYFDIDYKATVKKLDSLYKATKDLDYLSDQGFVLILQKKYEEAIKLYLKIEKLEPNRYATASNIGTAYELTGQNENALQWIKKAIEIDPGAHAGSEWIHEKILEAKIKGEQFYTTEFLLKINFGSASIPNSGISQEELYELHKQLHYQLNERVSFVKPKDGLVAQLLFDLGNTAYELGWYQYAMRDYELAQKYGFIGDLMDARINECSRGAEKNRKNIKPSARSKEVNWLGSILQFLLPLAVIVGIWCLLLYIAKRFNKTS